MKSPEERKDDGVSESVLSSGLWIQDEVVRSDRAAVWQEILDYLGIHATIKTVDGSLLLIEGEDEDIATAFIDEVTRNFPLGDYENGEDVIRRCIDKYNRR